MNLYDLTTGLRAVHNQIEDAGGELTPDLEKTLDNLNMELEVKALNIGRWVKNLNAHHKSLDEEIECLKVKKIRKENLVKRIKDYLKDNMIAVGKKKIEMPTMTVCIQGNPASVEIEDEDDIPARFKIVVPATFIIDKKELLKELKTQDAKKVELEKSGQSIEDFKDIPGANLIKDRCHLRIA